MARPVLAADAAPDEAAAIKIAAPALIEKMGRQEYILYMRYKHWVAKAQGDVWRAYPIIAPMPGLEDQEIDVPCDDHPGQLCVLAQFGGWRVIVDRASGKVLDVSQER